MNRSAICPARTSDREAVVACLVELAGEFGSSVDRQRAGGVIDQMLADDRHGFILVAQADDQIVGVAVIIIITSVHYAGRVAWLEELYVMPQRRGQGIGAALVSAVLQRGQDLGLVAVGLDVDARNERVISLYARLGFSRVPRSTWVKEFPSRR
jgi:ribosomal protein S18 acetylase RimI-like enzyme